MDVLFMGEILLPLHCPLQPLLAETDSYSFIRRSFLLIIHHPLSLLNIQSDITRIFPTSTLSLMPPSSELVNLDFMANRAHQESVHLVF